VLPGGSWTSPPNLLSLSRVAAAPLLVWLVLTEAWAPAVALVTAAGVSEQGQQPIHGSTHGWAGKSKYGNTPQQIRACERHTAAFTARVIAI
jgi:hypothetical protein